MSWKALRSAMQLGLLLVASDAMARNPGCQIAPFSGASSFHGTVAAMSVVNDGKPCGITLYGLPAERRNPATQGVIAVEPRHGKAEFVDAHLQYTPVAGYAGDDEFAAEAWAVGASSRSVPLKVRMKVIVRAPQ